MYKPRYQNIVDNFPEFKKVIVRANIICILVCQIPIALTAKRVFDHNDSSLLLLIAVSGFLLLIITHYLSLFILRKNLKYTKEKSEFELFISQNKIKYPFVRVFLISSLLIFFTSGFVVRTQITKENKKNSIEICCGEVYDIRYQFKRSVLRMYYYFNYNSIEYKGVTSQNSIEYNGLYHLKIGIPIFTGDEFKVSLHKDKPWHNDLIFSSPSDRQIKRFKLFLNNESRLYNITSLLDSIDSKFGFYGLIAYYHRRKENISKIDVLYRDSILLIQNDSCYQELVNRMTREKIDSLTKLNNWP